MRNLFIEVKQDLFKTYIENEEKFPVELQKLTLDGKKYFEDIKEKEYMNFKNWKTFHKLYKNETITYYIANFIILNMPILGKIIFYTRKNLKKLI
jgi:hypothetical protein